jgi:two-component system chemotaxis response regulator CheB
MSLRIVVAAESSFIRQALARLLADEPGLEVVGLAASGEELLRRVRGWNPDAVILDLALPPDGGLAALAALLAMRAVPVLLLTSHSSRDALLTIEALHRGAADFIDTQRYSLIDFEALRAAFAEKLRQITAARPPAEEESAAEPRPPAAARAHHAAGAAAISGCAQAVPAGPRHGIDLVVLGASTGGPPAIERILGDMGDSPAVPVAVVQHMPAPFTRFFAERLDATLALRVREAVQHDQLRPGVAYIAPAGRHLRIARQGEALYTALSTAPEGMLHCPSIDLLFVSAAAAARGRLVAVLLTGMGRDGAAAMAELTRTGVHTIVQDRSSSLIFGMPRAAIEAGGALEVLALPQIGPRLRELIADSS